jgi:signal peptidase II
MTAGSQQSPKITRMPDLVGHLLFWPIAVGGTAFDLWSKHAVFNWLPSLPGETYTIVDGYVHFILRENAGAAFSILHGQRWFLTSISAAAFFVVIGIFLFGSVHRRILQIALSCILGGIVGNFYDRAFLDGHVRDFVDVLIPVIRYNWPTFNVADSLLCIGVGLLIIANLTAPVDGKPDPQQTAAH